MDSDVSGLSGTSPGTGASSTTRETEEAAGTSPNSSEEAPAPRRVTKRRMKAKVSSPSPNNDSHIIGTRRSQRRVLRDRRTARGAVPCARAERCSRSKIDSRQKKPESPRRRGRPTGLRSKDTDAVGTVNKKPTAKKASPRKPQPKPPKSGKGQHRPLTQAPCSTPEKVCKTEPETEVVSCGVEWDTLKRNDENCTDEDVSPGDQTPPFTDNSSDTNYKPEARMEKQRRHPPRQKEEKKEKNEKETERESEDNAYKSEGSTEIAVKMEDGMGEDVEQPRKRGRRRKDDKTPQLPKRRKKPPVQYVRCEIEGCGTVLAHPRYLQHHIKYQHLLKKKYVCSHPSCGRLFRLQKQLLRHAKHHTDQRDYICEFCARAFKSSHNLAVHRMIHTGEKPIQCEICGFTCRQKASLNWHMKKHDADAFYQFSCSICGKKFEKKDCVVAHKAKSHPEVLIAEALAANAGTPLIAPAPVPETPPVVSSPDVHPDSQENQDALGRSLTTLQQVLLTPQTPTDSAQAQLLQLAQRHVTQLRQPQETPTLLRLATSTAHPQLIQLTALPVAAAACATSASSAAIEDHRATLLTLSSVTTLSPAATLAPSQAVEWADGETQLEGEGLLWDRVVVGGQQDVGEIVWEGDGERVRDDGGIVWGREGEGQILLDSADVRGDGLI